MKRWTREEETLLEREYPTRKISEIEKILGRSKLAIQSKAQDMGLQKPPGYFKMVEKQRVEELQISVRVRPLGNGRIPPMPGLLDLLQSMSGSMDSEIVCPNANRRNRVAKLEAVGPIIKDMLSKKMKYGEIAKEIGMSYYTVFEYVKEIRAAA